MADQEAPQKPEAAEIEEVVAAAVRNALAGLSGDGSVRESIAEALRDTAVARKIDEAAKAAVDKALRTQLAALGRPVFTGGEMLSHARSLFEYHAGQRLTSIRYFVVIYSVFTGAYFTVWTASDKDGLEYLVLAIISAIAAFVTRVFMRLDRRNSELVEVDELALRELEALAAKAHPVSSGDSILGEHWTTFKDKDPNGPPHPLNITRNADIGIFTDRSPARYSRELRGLFRMLLGLSILAAVPPVLWLAGVLEAASDWLPFLLRQFCTAC